jgi:glycosyltransferase involved in cell wall biosynthesis
VPRVLALSIASVNVPHRSPYDRLAREPGWSVDLVAPTEIEFGPGRRQACHPPTEGAAYALHALPVDRYLQPRLTLFRGLRALVKRLTPDVIYCEFDPGSAMTLQARASSWPGHVPVVCFTVENIDHPRWRQAMEHLLAREFRAAARDLTVAVLTGAGERAVDGLACINQEGLDIFTRERNWRQPITLMPLGTDVALFRREDAPARRASLGLDGAFVVGYFGRLTPAKAPHLLVEALAQLPQNVKLLLDMYDNFMPGSYADTMLSRADALHVRDRIVRINVSNIEVPAYMNVCDVVVLPSVSTPRWREQFGRVLPEAMACEVPVIGSRSGNIPAIIGDAGILFEEASTPGLVRAIEELMADPVRRRTLGAEGRQRVIAHFSVEAQVRQLKSLLERVLAARPGAPEGSRS